MQERILPFLRCPVTRSHLRLQVIERAPAPGGRPAGHGEETVILEGILFSAEDWCFPVTGGIPRLTVEAFLDYEDFFRTHLPDYPSRRQSLEQRYAGLLAYVQKKNKRTKQAFALEWSLHDYGKDRTWEAGREELLGRFLRETGESETTLKGKFIFDAGCGNGQLDSLIAQSGATVIAMDLSLSIERAYRQNEHPGAWYIQGDLQFPPLEKGIFDIVHCSGVLHHTNNTELSFACLEPGVRPGGKFSVWLYHPRRNTMHNLFNRFRSLTGKLPLRLQYWLLASTVFPLSWAIKRLKGNPQNRREMMISILDWFTPEFRWEHTHDEAVSWFVKRDYASVQITTTDLFGFNTTGIKKGDLL